MIETQNLPAIVAEVDESSAAKADASDTANVAAGGLGSASGQPAEFAEFDKRIRELEAAIGDLRSVSAAAQKAASPGRKTLPAHTEALLSKHGVSAEVQAASLDSALSSLSIEQRIAVKSQMLRAGLL